MNDIVYSGRTTADGDPYHRSSVCPCADCVQLRWVMSPEGSAEIRRRAVEEMVEDDRS